jgi:hypothetical protein
MVVRMLGSDGKPGVLAASPREFYPVHEYASRAVAGHRDNMEKVGAKRGIPA